MPQMDYNYIGRQRLSQSTEYMTSESQGQIMNHYHWHHHYEILVIFEGSYTVTNNTTIIRGSEPALFVHRPYSLHNAQADTRCSYRRSILAFSRDLAFKLDGTWIDMSLFFTSGMIHLKPSPDEFDEIAQIMMQVEHHPDDLVTRELYTSLILHKISLIYAAGRGISTDTGSQYIQDVLQEISTNLASPMTIRELAERFDVGITKLQRDIRNVVGKPYKKYLTDLRQTYARDLLMSGASIVNTAIDTGYANEAHFVKAFREYWGVTPGSFIKNL